MVKKAQKKQSTNSKSKRAKISRIDSIYSGKILKIK